MRLTRDEARAAVRDLNRMARRRDAAIALALLPLAVARALWMMRKP